MKRALVFTFTFIIFLFNIPAQAQKTSAENSYNKSWSRVDSLSNLGQPRSALEMVNVIYEKAKNEKNEAQLVKAVIYKLKLQSDFREDALLRSIYDLRKEVSASAPPVKQILTSMLAELYDRYYQANRWRFDDRSRVAGLVTDSINTWDLTTIQSEIMLTYRQSLQNETLLKSIPIEKFEPVLVINDQNKKKYNNRRFRPTLYDFLTWRALDYFTGGDEIKNQPSDAFMIADERHLLPAEEWLSVPLKEDTASTQSIALLLFRKLAEFHLSDPDKAALIDEENTRLEYVYQEAVFPLKDSFYIAALKKAESVYTGTPYSTDISFQLATFLNEQGSEYDPKLSDAHKWQKKEALEVCNEAIKKYPESDGAQKCGNLVKSILQKALNTSSEATVIPGKPSLATIISKNSDKIFFRIIKADHETINEKISGMIREERTQYFSKLPVFKSWNISVPLDGDLQPHSAEFIIPELPSGFYYLIACTSENLNDTSQAVTYTPLTATNISYVSRHDQKGGLLVYILDRESGKPLKNAEVTTFIRTYDYNSRKYVSKETGKYTADENGFLMVKAQEGENSRNFYMKIIFKDDIYFSESFYIYPEYRREQKDVYNTTFFTDRSIYRPGQTVYFKGIVVKSVGTNKEIAPGYSVPVTFFDVNSNKVEEKTLITNDYGSFNGSFTIPSTGLKGRMSLSTSTGTVAFSVEEYKRPTFEAEFIPVEGNFRVNDSIRVTGKATAYAGNVITGAKVSYRVVRTAIFPFRDFWWFPFPQSPEVEILNGTTTTGPDGTFAFTFYALPDLSLDKNTDPVFSYNLTADVTDLNGETSQAEGNVSAGYKSLVIAANVPEKFNSATDTAIIIKAMNLNARKTPATISYELHLLKQPEKVFEDPDQRDPDLFIIPEEDFKKQFPGKPYRNANDPSKWAVEKTILSGTMDTEKDSVLMMKKQQPGFYRLVMKSTDPFGQTVTATRHFTVFDPDSKEIPLNTTNWFVSLKSKAEPGENAEFLIGTKDKDVNIIYEMILRDSVISRQWITLNNEQKKIIIPVKEEFRGNFSVSFIFVKDNQAYQNSANVIVPFSNKKLDIKLESFRNKLIPGSDEEWKIKITGPGGKAAEAEFLASMYDASLDAFEMHSWWFDVFNYSFMKDPWSVHMAFRSQNAHGESIMGNFYYNARYYDELDWFGFGYSGRMRKGGNVMYDMSVVEYKAPMAEESPSGATGIEVSDSTVTKVIEPAQKSPEEKIPVKIRTDFRETAFFYPSLMTDPEGNVILKFTVPESLTKWKLLGLAHSKDLKTGMITQEVVTQKDLMVFPNVPRFVRQGDTLVLSAKISNLSNRALAGDVVLKLTDALSGNTITISGASTIPFTIPAGLNSSVEWKVAIPVDASLSMMLFNITAQSGQFSDGEERMIPVLTNRMMVTESLPMPVRGAGTFSFNFDKLEKSKTGSSLKNYRLTLEFASNPVWYAIQALPTLEEPKYKSADALFNSFYANSIASHIANSDPKIMKVFESWKQITPDALLSNLEKNQDLKYAVIEETPWLMEAKDESASKRAIATLFDMNTLSARLSQNLAKLRELQKPEGGWSWFEGMRADRYTTQQIVTGFGRLMHLGIKNIRSDNETWSMVSKAVGFIDNELVRDFEWLKKHDKKYLTEDHLSGTTIQYLYMRSYFMKEIPVAKGTKEAFDYYKKQSEKYWLKQDIYFQGMIALALNRLGNTEIPGLVMKSLSEKALHSPEMGMYWATNHGWYWYEAPVETQALLIEAFDEVKADKSSVDEMKIWLLKQKQTTSWNTGRATADACYAILLRGQDLLIADQKVTFKVGNETIDPSKLSDTKTEAGTGYFKMSWNGKEITPEMGNVKVTKTGEGIAWGAMYWQYFEDLDKITQAQSPLRIEKKVFIETNTPNGPVLEAVSESKPLAKGKMLKIRIILTTDRDLEYVHMKDMRASAFEPVISATLSGYRYQDGLGYYQSTGDAATNFFFDYLPKGTYVFEYPLIVNAAGKYSNGITTVQCMYAPEFGAHSEGIRVRIIE